MVNRSIDVKKIITPANATEVFALLAIIGGLCIALFLPELPIRLIGICVSILGGVGHFMMISQRLSETVEYSRKPVSANVSLRTVEKSGNGSRRIIFDDSDFKKSFGDDDVPDEIPENNPEEEVRKKVASKFTDELPKKESDGPSKQSGVRHFGDDISHVRIVGKAKSSTPKPTQRREVPPPMPPKPKPSPEVQKQVAHRAVEIVTEPVVQYQQKTEEHKSPSDEPQVEHTSSTESSQQQTYSDMTVDTGERVAQDFSAESNTHNVPTSNESFEVVENKKDSENQRPAKRHTIDVDKLDLSDETPLVPHNEPRKELDFLLNRVLMVIRSVTNARTAAFFWVNADKQHLVLEAFISDIKDSISEERKFKFSGDVISQVAQGGRPEILTEIKSSAELDLIPYYHTPSKTVSFIGVPVYYHDTVVGVLCADSEEPDAYDAITVSFFGHFTKLISGLVQSYTGKYDLLQANRALEVISKFRNLLANADTAGISAVCTSIIQAAAEMVDATLVGTCLYDEYCDEWIVNEIRPMDERTIVLRGTPVDLQRSVIGKTIQTASTTLLAPLEPEMIRVTDAEPEAQGGSFLAVPLKSLSHSYGTLFIEARNSFISHHDISILELLGEQAGTMIEQLRFNAMFDNSAMLDRTKGILNRTAFQQRMDEEIARAGDFNIALSLCLVQIDHYIISEMSQDAIENLTCHVVEILRRNLNAYDVVGESNEGMLAVLLIGRTAQQAHLWAEKMRKEVAISIVDMFGKRFSVTVCIGVSQARARETSDALHANTERVLSMALQRTNTVSVFD
ncbi:MAG TPA: GAF domain-containing protein [Candidatus Kapabacteria bacterium]|nr:GAF domain-containing protein [Candidatus Kapabacteria bacterium]